MSEGATVPVNYLKILSQHPEARDYLRYLAEAPPAPTTEPESMYRMFRSVLARGIAEQERVAVAAFDRGLQLVDVSVLFVGSARNVPVCIPTVLRWTLTRSRPCSCFALAHNHPSGDPTPSVPDRAFTEKVEAAAQTVQLGFIDHMIVGRGTYFSMMEAGMLGAPRNEGV